MDDSPDPRSLDRDGPDARLRAALRALDAAADRADAVAPDPSRVAGHLAGVGDEGLLREAAAHPSVRRLLSDVVSVAPSAEADLQAASRTPGALSFPSADVMARALAAFDASAAGSARAPGAGASVSSGLRVVGAPTQGAARLPQGVRRRTWRVAAAVLALLVPLGVLSFVSGRAEAGPVIALEGLERVGADGAVATEGPRRLVVGATVTGLPGERLALRMSGGGRVVLPGEDVVRVACGDTTCGRALFALDRGEVVLAVSGDGDAVEPVAMRLPRGERFDLLAGAARVSREPAIGGTDDRIVIVLRDDAVARWTPASGGVRDLRGGGTLVLEGGAGPVLRSGSRAEADSSVRALFHDLEFFGGARRDPSPQRRVGARRWRILGEDTPPTGAGAGTSQARVRRSEGSGVPAIRMDIPVDGRARMAWQPDEPALLSRRLRVHVRWAPVSGKGAAPETPSEESPGRLRVELEGVPGAFAECALSAVGEARPADLELTLPDAWASGRGAAADLVLVVGVTAQPVTVWFECAGFDSSDAAPPRVPSVGVKHPRGE